MRRDKEERDRRERQKLVQAHAEKYSLCDTMRLEVACPVRNGGSVSTIESCAACQYFLDAVYDGIICYGSAMNN